MKLDTETMVILSQNITKKYWLFFFASLLFPISSFSQTGSAEDSIYYKNFVKHADGNSCLHKFPSATFTTYLNSDQNKILVENAPRWKKGSEPNIAGNGTFGIELANFIDSPPGTGDSVFVRYTCNETGQQGIIKDRITGIPWCYFPKNLFLSPIAFPPPPHHLKLSNDSLTHYRTLSWDWVNGLSYDIYRRNYSDTLSNGTPCMLYRRVGHHHNSAIFIDSTTVASEKYGYIIYAVNADGLVSSHSVEVNEDPYIKPGMDLDVRYIARLPRLDYVLDSEAPGITGWPSVNSSVTWQAVVKNWSDSNLVDVPYRWFLDGNLADSGVVSILPGDTAVVNYFWAWTFDRHKLKMVIDPQNKVAEEEESNNDLEIYTDAISVGFYVEKSVYDYFHQYQKDLDVHSNSWDDWAQRHVKTWNTMFSNAVYLLTPTGVLDRIRIDKIVVVPDGALPLHGGLASNNPNLQDRSVDLQWGFASTLLEGNFYADHTATSTNNAFYFEGSLMHELGHARYLIDQYGFNVHDNGSGNNVGIKESGKLIAGTEYLPVTGGDVVHSANYKGLMNGQYTYVDEYSAAALNLIAGHRAVEGNCNAPGNIGVFLQDLPTQNWLTIKDSQNKIIANANVEVFRAESKNGEWYGKYYDDQPDMELLSDGNGTVALGRCPFSEAGKIEHGYGYSNGVIIIRVQANGKVGFGFLEVTDFNMAYWRGDKTEANYELSVNLIEPVGIANENALKKLDRYSLVQNYPNPFNPVTVIQYSLPTPSNVSLEIFDMLGKKVRNLVSNRQRAGNYTIVWDGRSDQGKQCSSGIYYCKLSAGKSSFIKKMLLMK